MKKDTLLEIILGTIGGLIFAIGMCMCLIAEWNMLKALVVVEVIGFLILLCIITVYRRTHTRKKHGPVNWGIVITWIVGVVGSLVMGFGMSKVLVENASQTDMIIGIITGIIGLVICVLNYPIYAYIKGNRDKL